MVILLGVLFTTTGIQNRDLQKQLADISLKLDKLQTLTNDGVMASIAKLNQQSSSTKSLVDTSSNLSDIDTTGVLSPENLKKTLGAQTSVPQTTLTPTSSEKAITLKSGLNNIDVYEATKTSSHITGQLTSGKNYPIVSIQQDWYLIRLDATNNAWIQSQFVNETS